MLVYVGKWLKRTWFGLCWLGLARPQPKSLSSTFFSSHQKNPLLLSFISKNPKKPTASIHYLSLPRAATMNDHPPSAAAPARHQEEHEEITAAAEVHRRRKEFEIFVGGLDVERMRAKV
jgi:hypothetical protein